MKVSIVGAGPAGLYLGILLKKANSRNDIEVIERNAPDATFGWGVVFSGETLGALRDADLPTYLEITDTFARWDAVDIRYRGELLSSRGHAFAGISRRALLAILQRRCAQLQVKMRFETEIRGVGDVDDVDTDLIVAADGVNSVFRRAHADHLGAEVTTQGGKYVWFGTDLVLDAFRFIFKQTEHGLFQVHSYPFDENTSTFIVECPETVWRSAGLDEMTEVESIAYCEELFADDLDGHVLLSNRSQWLDFQRVHHQTWHFKGYGARCPVVLLGDAAHTAHFSIGSGTKLAMEDAIALANALVRQGNKTGTKTGNVERALVDYELERRPLVERVQLAADESAAYFERVPHHSDLAPRQFAMNLLTRSGRITHGNLALRDPIFVRRFDSWFGGVDDKDAFAPAPLFTPMPLGRVTLKNRVAVAVRTAQECAMSHASAALRVVQVAVTDTARVTAHDPTADHLELPVWRQAIDQAHDAGAAVMIRLGHAGRRGATQPRDRGVDLPLQDGWPLLSASAVPYGPLSAVPKEMDASDMAAVTSAFAEAAGRAALAGADVVAVDAAHGHLLASFLSPLSNLREDEYGGSLENRLRFPLEVIAEVRDSWPADLTLAVRLTVDDWRGDETNRGIDIGEGVAMATVMREAGVQLIHVEAGQSVANDRPQYRRRFLTTLADRVRSEAGVTTLVGGYLTTLDDVNTIVAAGRADLCLLEAQR